jgi:hypothetical protein
MLELEKPSGPTLRWESIYQVIADALQSHDVETLEILRTLANAAEWEDVTAAADTIARGDAAIIAKATDAARRHFEGLQRAQRPVRDSRSTSSVRLEERRAKTLAPGSRRGVRAR